MTRTLPPLVITADGVKVRLWPRLAAVMTALAVVPVLLVAWQAFRSVVGYATEKNEEILWAEARLKADLLGRWVHDLAPMVDVMPELYRLDQLTPAARAGFVELVARVLPSVQEVVLVERTGRSVAPPVSVGTPDPNRPDLVRGLPISEALADPDHVHMGAAWPSIGQGPATFPMAVVANSGAPPADRWILGLRVALDPGVHLDDPAATHAVLVLDPQGRVLMGDPGGLLDPARLVPLLGTEATFETEAGAGASGVLVPIVGTPGWSLVVADRSTNLLASALEIRRNLVPQLVVAVALAVALAFVFAGSLSGPVERLRDAVLKIAEGTAGVRADVQRTDEIGDLARAFDHLAARLEANRAEISAQQGEIAAFNLELQARVDERTRELRDAQEGLVRSGQLAAVAEIGAGLAHDLNNPLAAVLGLAQVLRARHPDEALLVDLETEATRCRDVVDTLRRVQAPQLDSIDAPVVSLSALVEQAVQLVSGSFRRRGVALVLDGVDDGLLVRIDPVQGGRVVAQLLNALAAGLEPAATVRCRGHGSPERVELNLLTDRPIGTHPDRRDDWLASGHGLWVARQLLERMGGGLDERTLGSGVEWTMWIRREPAA